MIFVLLLYALFASVFTISKIGLSYTQPLFFVGSRMVLAGLLMLGYQVFIKRKKLQISRTLIFLALFNIYFTNIFEFWGLKYLTSFKTCFIYSLSPFLSALFSYFIFSDKMSYKKWLGLIIGFVGLGPILLSQTESEHEFGQLLFLSWPEISVILAAICSVYGWILLKQCVNKGLSPLMANGFSMLMGGSLALFHSFLTENWNPIPVMQFLPFVECTLLLILISNLICYNLYGNLLKKFSATFMSFAGFSTPIFTAIYGWLFLEEKVGSPFYLSLVIVFSGLSIFYFEELKGAYKERLTKEAEIT